MLTTTEGIVLHSIPYSEHSLILKIYTRELGLSSFVISSGKGRKGKNKALLQPLSLVQLVSAGSPGKQLGRITELSSSYPYLELQTDPVKSCIALFLNEILYRSIKEDHPDPELFDYLSHSIKFLDLYHGSVANFHLVFLLQFSRFLGFYPQNELEGHTGYFDLQEGKFVASRPIHPNYLSPELSVLLEQLKGKSFELSSEVALSSAARKDLLASLILYFRFHVPNFGEIRSHKILEEVLS